MNIAKLIVPVFTILMSIRAIAVDLNFYLPEEQFNPNIPTPESILGYQVGDWHVRHDQLIQYFEALAASSDRVVLKDIGKSHEHRRLIQLFISHPDKLNNLEQLREQHLQNVAGDTIKSDSPLVINLNYSVHGDEPSGSNASMLVAYYLAASNDPKVQEYLNNMVIILDPSLNPDGLSRFAQWANENKGKNLNGDPNHREHIQGWIRGRVNHYWFDLNRDWLLLQHPESRARISQYHDWRPNVVTDHHEMGAHSTFFFQPGIPSRKNPHTPDENVKLTQELAKFHAAEFDKDNTLYFTEEAFDDFYAGKGSTYPDLTGSIGILFEQASSRGYLQHTINGDLTFPSTIYNQVRVTFSTLAGSFANKQTLQSYQQEFQKQAFELAEQDTVKGYLLSEQDDKTRFNKLIRLLQRHKINAFAVTRNAKIGDQVFAAGKSVFVPLAQPQYRLIKSIFSKQRSFFDNTFYDVSSWNLPMAYNVEFAEVKSLRSLKVATQPWSTNTNFHNAEIVSDAVAYVIDWRDYAAPKLVYKLLENDINLRATTKPFSANVSGQIEQFPAGSVVVNAGLQQGQWFETFTKLALESGAKISSLTTGLTSKGIDLGSRNMRPLSLPKVLVVGGPGMNPYEAGELWYFMDHQLGFSPTVVEKQRLTKLDLSNYSHVLLVDAQFTTEDKGLINKLDIWTRQGGTLWAQKRAATSLAQFQLLKSDVLDPKSLKELFDTEGLQYGDRESLAAKQRIAGAFFNAKLDLTHPLAFGFSKDVVPLFKNTALVLKQPNKPFVQVAEYTKQPLLAGFAHETNVDQIAESSALLAQKHGKGVIVAFADNPSFRAITHGSQRLLINVLFFSNML